VASKHIVDYFGTASATGSKGGEFSFSPPGVAVNQSGAGPANAGDVYVVDGQFPTKTHRIQRFGRDDNGTPDDGSDDTYFFISAWGAGVETGGSDYEICTQAAACGPGVASGGNGTLAGNGALSAPTGVAVDQDTGDVHVLDGGNSRVNVYAGDGTFLRSFGYDVVKSGPGQLAGPNEEQKLTIDASAGKFSLGFEGRATGPRGTGWRGSIGAKTLTQVVTTEGNFAVGQGISGEGLATATTITALGAGTLDISKPTTGATTSQAPLYGDTLDYNAPAAQVESALNGLPSIGGVGGSVTVTGSNPYSIQFGGSLAGEDMPLLEPTFGGLVGPYTVTLANATGGTFTLDLQVTSFAQNKTEPIPYNASAAFVQGKAEERLGAGNVSVTGPSGGPWSLKLTGALAEHAPTSITADGSKLTGASPHAAVTPPASAATIVDGGVYEICQASEGDICKAGGRGDQLGEIGKGGGESAEAITIGPPDGDSAAGTVFLADTANHRVNSYDIDGSPLSSFGAAAKFGFSRPNQIAVDSRGIVYVNKRAPQELGGDIIERYDTQDANGNGTGFLDPITFGVNEVQWVTVNAAAGQFKLSFGGDSTGNLPFNASSEQVQSALNALPSLEAAGAAVRVDGGPGNSKGSSPYVIRFRQAFTAKDVGEITASVGGVPLSGGSGASVATFEQGNDNVDAPIDEQQWLTVNAAAGQFKLGFGASSTADLSFNASAAEVAAALNALSSIAGVGGSVAVSGGPGDATGSSPYKITFGGSLAKKNVSSIAVSTGTSPLSGGNGVSSATRNDGEAGLAPGSFVTGLAVDLDLDGNGPEADVLYSLAGGDGGLVQQFGPLNAPGLASPPTGLDDQHAGGDALGEASALAQDEATDRLYVAGNNGAGQAAGGVYVLDDVGPPPTATLDSLSDITATTVTANASINPNGPPALSYHLEYSTDGSNWKSGSSTLLGAQKTAQSVETVLDPVPGGLNPNTFYHVRLVAKRPFFKAIVTAEKTFTTLPGPPTVETAGSPVRTASTAQLEGRVNPRGSTTTYRFEYGAQGACDANPCTSTDSVAAGSGQEIRLVSKLVEGLEANTTYHYRVVAENGAQGSPAFGQDVTLTTRATDAPFSHGHLAGPPGSDRAYEQVSLPDAGGNPVTNAYGVSDAGDRAIYRVFGGTPASETGSFGSVYFAERKETAPHQGSWQTRSIIPPRSQIFGASWLVAGADGDLSTVLAENVEVGSPGGDIWALASDGNPSQLFHLSSGQEFRVEETRLSADGSRAVAVLLGGALDPAHPGASDRANLYDIGSNPPQLLSLLPGDAVPACGANIEENAFGFGRQPSSHPVSADGSRLYFNSRGNTCSSAPQLFMREIDAGQTKLLSGPPVSGQACAAALLKATADAVFFWTTSRLVAQDTAQAACPGTSKGGDVYRYDLDTAGLSCVTCLVPDLDANVEMADLVSGGPVSIAVADDGSRIYFRTHTRLLPGAAETGAYRVNVSSGDLAYIGPVVDARLGEVPTSGGAISADGSVLIFRSASPALNPVSGTNNGGTSQYYRYDDRDRSLVCVSCPPSGQTPRGDVSTVLLTKSNQNGPNATPLSADGRTFAFASPSSLAAADQNTAGAGQNSERGADVYEWRDGRLLLVSDGLTDWTPGRAPAVTGMTASGHDLYFIAAAQYTADALDGYERLYDARIGGGFEFPPPPSPCPLEVCQGTPKGAPEERAPGTGTYVGPGNAKPESASKPRKKKHRKKHKKKRRKHAAKDKRRASR
jgi:hypothetical protein